MDTLCYAIVLPGWKSGFRAGFRSESSRESLKIGPPAGLRQPQGQFLSFPDQNPAEPGSPISGPEALLRNMGYEKPKPARLLWRSIVSVASGFVSAVCANLQHASLFQLASLFWTEHACTQCHTIVL